MRRTFAKRFVWAAAGALLVAAAIWFAWPRPIQVDFGNVARERMEVTVDEEAKTRVRHVYTVSAPIAGKVLRISHPFGGQGAVSVHVGDSVKAAETVVAVMQPTVPGFLDVRSREELQAMLTAADAAVTLAEAEVRRIEAALEFARSDLRRSEALARTNSTPERNVEKARLDVQTNEAALASAQAQRDVKKSERASVAARLMDPATAPTETKAGCCIQLRAPVTGVVLRIIQDSEAFVSAGAPLIEIGDPLDLEIWADLLSTDAVRVKVGAPVRIDGWGGRPIQGRVMRVDPAGFLKVSALGIEEQRVRTTIDFSDTPEAWSRLGHDYRVIVHVTTWSADDVLTVPVAALFRRGEDWAVYVAKDGRAKVTKITIGHRTNRTAEVLSGLSAGDKVVLHPSDRISEGTAVELRRTQ